MKRAPFLRRKDCRQSASPVLGEVGGVFIEFVFVLPLMLIFAGYGLRLANQLQAREIASILSRELATRIFTNCVDITIQDVSTTCTTGICVDAIKTKAAIQGCLNQIETQFNTKWSALKPTNSTTTTSSADLFVLEVYRYDIGSFTINPDCSSASGATTQLYPPTGEAIALPPNVTTTQMCQRNRAVRAQVKFNVTPLAPGLAGVSTTAVEIKDETVM